MNPYTIIGILLLVLGTGAFAYEKITYTTHEKVVDVGGVQASVEKKESVPIPPLVSVVTIIGGVALILVGSRKT